MDTIDELKKTHGSAYTPMQFRIWSEMMVGGMLVWKGHICYMQLHGLNSGVFGVLMEEEYSTSNNLHVQ